jgi:hypothetical protein
MPRFRKLVMPFPLVRWLGAMPPVWFYGHLWSGVSGRSPLAYFDPQREMHEASRCRTQAQECHRLMLLARSGAEATILTSLTRSWKMIASQTDRYIAIMKKDAAERS